MHEYAEDLIKAMEGVAERDPSLLPGLELMALVRQKLVGSDFSSTNAELIVSRMKIEIAEGALDREQLERLATALATVFINVHNRLIVLGFLHPTVVITEIARTISVKLC